MIFLTVIFFRHLNVRERNWNCKLMNHLQQRNAALVQLMREFPNQHWEHNSLELMYETSRKYRIFSKIRNSVLLAIVTGCRSKTWKERWPSLVARSCSIQVKDIWHLEHKNVQQYWWKSPILGSGTFCVVAAEKIVRVKNIIDSKVTNVVQMPWLIECFDKRTFIPW